MKTTFEFRINKELYQLILKVSTYPDGNLAIKLYTEDRGSVDFWDSLTINPGGIRPKDCAFIHSESGGKRIFAWIKRNRLAVPTGHVCEIDGIEYPEYLFNGKRLLKFDSDGYTYYARRQKRELGRKYERLYIALKLLSKNINGFHYTDYSGWRNLPQSSATLPLWIEAEDQAGNRRITITHQGAVLQLTVTDSSGEIRKIPCRRKEDIATGLLALFTIVSSDL